MMRHLVLCLLLLLLMRPVQAQTWGVMCPKAVLTNDVQVLHVGTQSGQNPFYQAINDVGARADVAMQFFLNGQPNNPEQPEPNGSILSGNYYDVTRREYLRRVYYRAPSKMPAKNPVELTVIVTPANSPPVTVTWTITIVAERWSFQYFQALRYKCYDGGPTNPRNIGAVDMGVATGSEQWVYFKPFSLNPQTGEGVATPDGEPEIYQTKTYQGGGCDPGQVDAKLLWGDDDQTKIKHVVVRYAGGQMKVDYEIDYMNYLGWELQDRVSGKTIVKFARRPGKHDAKASFVCPLQDKFRSMYAMPPDQQVMLHVASGIQLRAEQK